MRIASDSATLTLPAERPYEPHASEAAALRVLVVHNHYQQRGGEDHAFEQETNLLEQRGHTVIRYTDHNNRISEGGLGVALNTVWSRESFRKLRRVMRDNAVSVAHFHNTFPLISPSAYFAARECGVPVVQTLHNYRLLCPAGTFLRNGKICEQCLERKSLLPSVVHGCYRGSRAATATVAGMLQAHRANGTWNHAVDAYVAVSQFARRKFIEGGLPAQRIFVRSSFIHPDPGTSAHVGDYAVFIGRHCEEKGVRTLAEAWTKLPEIPLTVTGDGPLRDLAWPASARKTGFIAREALLTLLREARFLVLPSIWYEGAPATILEAFACGVPVIASGIGSMPEFVEHMRTGLLFRAGDAEDLAARVRWAWEHPEEMRAMRATARHEYESKYTAEHGYRMLADVYSRVIENASGRKLEA